MVSLQVFLSDLRADSAVQSEYGDQVLVRVEGWVKPDWDISVRQRYVMFILNHLKAALQRAVNRKL